MMNSLVSEMREVAREKGDAKLSDFAGRISDMGDIDGQEPISRSDNVMVTQIATDAVLTSAIDKMSYLKFEQDIAPDAAATMLSTNEPKAVRALTHLLDNARKFTTEGEINLSYEVLGNQVRVNVTDTGKGVAEEDQSRIFERFVKVDEYVPGAGLGLCLAICPSPRLP